MIIRSTSNGKLKKGTNRPSIGLNQGKNMAMGQLQNNHRVNQPLILKINHLRQKSHSSNQTEVNSKENRSCEQKEFIVRKRVSAEKKKNQERLLDVPILQDEQSRYQKYQKIIKTNITRFIARTAGAKALVQHAQGFLQFHPSATQMLTEFSKQLLDQIQKITYSSKSKPIIQYVIKESLPVEKTYEKLQIGLTVNEHVSPLPKNLSCNSHIVEEHMQFQSELKDGQRLWSLCQKAQRREATEEELHYVLQKLDFLLREVSEREQQKRALSIELEEYTRCLQLKVQELQSLSSAIAVKRSELERFEGRLQETKEYIDRQPCEFLRIAVAEYKKSRQELFNLADFLNASEADKIDIWIGNGIKVANRAHGVYLKQFCTRRFDEHGRSSVSKEELAVFREKLEKNYATVIRNYDKLLEERIVRIEEFVDLMRKVAVTTVYKRDHVDDINKKLAAANVLLEQQYERVEGRLRGLLANGGEGGDIVCDYQQLQRLNKVLADLFTEAMVFY